MLKALSLAFLLLASPVFAAKKAPEAPKCYSMDDVAKKVPSPLLVKLDGDKLAEVKKKYPAIPDEIEVLMVFGAKDADVFITVGFIKGCAVGHGLMAPVVALPLIGIQVEDGSI